MSWPADLQNLLTDYYQNKAKLSNLTGVLGAQALEDGHDELQKNRNAESEHVRRTVWGSQEGEQASQDEDVRTTVLGDITVQQPQPQQQAQQQSQIPTTLATLALAAATGAGGYLLAGKEQQPAQVIEQPQAAEYSDESVTIGLGKIEDYLKKAGE